MTPNGGAAPNITSPAMETVAASYCHTPAAPGDNPLPSLDDAPARRPRSISAFDTSSNRMFIQAGNERLFLESPNGKVLISIVKREQAVYRRYPLVSGPPFRATHDAATLKRQEGCRRRAS